MPHRGFGSRRFDLSTSNASHRLTAVTGLILWGLSGLASAQTAPYAPPQSPRAKMNFNLNWKFIREDVPGAEAPGFDDSAWTTVSLPHSFNDVDSFRKIISP